MSEEKKKCGCLGRLLKFLLWCVVGVFALVVLLLATMPLWFSPIVTSAANSAVPKLTGTDFRVERFYVNPWTGKVCIDGVKLSNPEGYGEAPAFSMMSFTFDIAIMPLFSNTLHIEELLIEDAFASYFSHDGVNNFDAILENVNKAIGEKKEKKEKEEKDEKEGGELKVIIDHLRISGTKVKLMEASAIPPIPIMTIELNDIGKKSNGATLEEVWKDISDAFMKSMGNIGDSLNALGGILGDGAKSLGDGAKSLTDSAKSLTDSAKSITDGAKSLTDAIGSADAAGSIKEGTAATVNAVGDTAKNVTEATADAAKNAAAGASDLTKSAVDAVGDTTKKATEGVKNLFKGFGN